MPQKFKVAGPKRSGPRSGGSQPSQPGPSGVADDADDPAQNFILELRWCLQQLEIALQDKGNSKRKVDELTKAHRSLSNPRAPAIKRRQLMRSLFGDYRAKMAAEEKRYRIDPRKIQINTESRLPSSSRFVKRSSVSINKDLKFDGASKDFQFNFNAVENAAENSLAGEESPKEVVSGESVVAGVEEETCAGVSSLAESLSTMTTTEANEKYKFSSSKNEFRFNFSLSDE